MALIVRLSIFGLLGEQPLEEFLEVVNIGPPAAYRPGAVDLRRYEVRLRSESAVRWEGTVDHLRSNGAWRLARLAMDGVDRARRTMSDIEATVIEAGFELESLDVRVLRSPSYESPSHTLEERLQHEYGVPVTVSVVPPDR